MKFEVIHQEPARKKILTKLKVRALKTVVKNARPYFVRPTDKISLFPLLGKNYEEDIVLFIRYFASSGFDGFFVDIGANIGLHTCQTGALFQKIYCFEPNESILGVLHSNVFLSGLSEKTKIMGYGLGNISGDFEIEAPPNNLGGGLYSKPR